MKYDGKCLHGARPGDSGDCTEDRQENSVLCPFHHDLVIQGLEKAPPLRMVHDYVSTGSKTFLVENLPGFPISDPGPHGPPATPAEEKSWSKAIQDFVRRHKKSP